MNTTPQATISAFTLEIVVVLAVSTGNTCAKQIFHSRIDIRRRLRLIPM
jgi:hypothetical protein